MAMAAGEDAVINGDSQRINAPEEKIFVSIRVRPLNEKERARKDVSDWQCINNNTILYTNSNLQERSAHPDAYTFDRVFGTECSTKHVYEEGIKEVALSVVQGVNSSIFAYGQTSSGKTYTMRGITEYAVKDIYKYIEMCKDKEFVLKFSAMEIYNESVRDLLGADSIPLRLLDDPEKGTIIEKLTEETLRDWNHLQDLLSICAAQRKIGETSLNEMSSRSHQILRLAVESYSAHYVDSESSSTLAASVDFVDLAGSERASQTLSAGARLREGSHINRSLLTLGTVIRKLSNGRNGHVPYRESKLTRILQTSLGGNARTAIICTLSPARTHVEQSRNTLLFAGCAKQVTTSAHVNIVMSDKVLVKQLQRELARLEMELRSCSLNSTKPDSDALLKEKDILIEQMGKEIKELTQQRDTAQSLYEYLLQSVERDQLLAGDDLATRTCPRCQNPEECTSHTSSKRNIQHSENSPDNSLLNNIPIKNDQIDDTEPEYICKEVRCIEMEESREADSPSPASVERGLSSTTVVNNEDVAVSSSPMRTADDDNNHNNADTYDVLNQKIKEMQRTIECLIRLGPGPSQSSPSSSEPRASNPQITRSMSCRPSLMANLPSEHDKLNLDMLTSPSTEVEEKDVREVPESSQSKTRKVPRRHSPASEIGNSVEVESIIDSDAEDTTSVLNFGVKPNRASTSQLNNNSSNTMALERRSMINGHIQGDRFQASQRNNLRLNSRFTYKFERQQREVIKLWDACNVPLVHRSQFFLLFKGEPSDLVYMDVELKRLSYLKRTFSSGAQIVEESEILSLESSRKTLNRERKMLSKQVHKKLSKKEREEIYRKWGIDLKTKERSLQLACSVWTKTSDMNHVKESAILVAKLVGFLETGQAPKIFGLGFGNQQYKSSRSHQWRDSMSTLM